MKVYYYLFLLSNLTVNILSFRLIYLYIIDLPVTASEKVGTLLISVIAYFITKSTAIFSLITIFLAIYLKINTNHDLWIWALIGLSVLSEILRRNLKAPLT